MKAGVRVLRQICRQAWSRDTVLRQRKGRWKVLYCSMSVLWSFRVPKLALRWSSCPWEEFFQKKFQIGFFLIWKFFLFRFVINCIIFCIKLLLRFLPADLLVENNIQLLTPTSKCIGTCQKKLMRRLGRSGSGFRPSVTNEQSSAGSYNQVGQSGYGPLFSDDEHDVSPLANGIN